MDSPLALVLSNIFMGFYESKQLKFTIEKQINHSIGFLDVFISGINNLNLTL